MSTLERAAWAIALTLAPIIGGRWARRILTDAETERQIHPATITYHRGWPDR